MNAGNRTLTAALALLTELELQMETALSRVGADEPMEGEDDSRQGLNWISLRGCPGSEEA